MLIMDKRDVRKLLYFQVLNRGTTFFSVSCVLYMKVSNTQAVRLDNGVLVEFPVTEKVTVTTCEIAVIE